MILLHKEGVICGVGPFYRIDTTTSSNILKSIFLFNYVSSILFSSWVLSPNNVGSGWSNVSLMATPILELVNLVSFGLFICSSYCRKYFV